MNKQTVIKASIFLGSCLATLLIFEGALRVITARKNIYTIEMVKYAKALKMKDPAGVLSHIHRPNSQAKLMGVNIKLNELGHRGANLPSNKNRNAKRIHFLGSSITMGWGVTQEQVFSSVLESRLNNEKPFAKEYQFETANAGIGNYNTYYQYELFKRQYGEVSPDLVVLHYFINDAEDNPKTSNPFAKYSLLAAYLNSEFQGMYFKYFGGRDLASYYRGLYQADNQQWMRTLGYIARMQAIAEKGEAKFLVMIVPDTHNLEVGTPYEDIYTNIEASFKGRGFKTLNAFSAFQKRFGNSEHELWVQHDDPHPNEKGHALMSKLLFDYLARKDPLKLGQSPSLALR